MTLICVIAAVVDGTKLTLYKEDGSTVQVLQGDPQLKSILNKITPIISNGGVAEIEFDTAPVYKTERDDSYKNFEEKSGGITKLFRIAKKFVKSIMHPEQDDELHHGITVTPQVIGPVPLTPIVKVAQEAAENNQVVEVKAPEKLTSAIDEIIANATPVSHKSFDDRDTTEEETIIAVTDNKIVPGVENIKSQFANANKLGSTTGVDNFIRRVAAIIDQRGHSMQELLNFMSRGDLPIADDGSILAYKVLTTDTRNSNLKLDAGYFVDVHSRKVIQRVGSFVCMDHSIVDKSRRTQCSTGLHIARRGYLRGFGGNIIVLCKIAPEDVLAVPQGEPDKMRVAGYHIVSCVPDKEHENLRSNEAIKGTEAQRLLGMAMRGEHIGKIEEVRITGAMGSAIKVTVYDDVAVTKAPKPTTAEPKVAAIPLEKPETPEKVVLNAPVVDPSKVATKVAKTKEGNSRNQRAMELKVIICTSTDVEAKKDAAAELLKLKSKSKVSWIKLGLTDAIGIAAKELLNTTEGDTVKASEAATKPVKAKPEQARVAEKKDATVSPETIKEPKTMETKSIAQEARMLFEQAIAGDRSRWSSLWSLKKRAKKGWDKLGFSEAETKRIITNKPDHI